MILWIIFIAALVVPYVVFAINESRTKVVNNNEMVLMSTLLDKVIASLLAEDDALKPDIISIKCINHEYDDIVIDIVIDGTGPAVINFTKMLKNSICVKLFVMDAYNLFNYSTSIDDKEQIKAIKQVLEPLILEHRLTNRVS